MAYQSVYDNWVTFNKNKEGYLRYMYADQKNFITTGMGNKIDDGSSGPALSMPWKDVNGNPASKSAIAQEWSSIKNAGRSGMGGGNQARFATLFLDDSYVLNTLIPTVLQGMEVTLRERFPGYDSWPADAQMGILSMAWAMGPDFKFPKFEAAANRAVPDFLTMAAESDIPELGSGDGGRNQDNLSLFTNAANVLVTGADPSSLYWPGAVIATAKRTLVAALAGFFLAGFGLLGYDWATSNFKTTKSLSKAAVKEAKVLLK